MTTISREVLFYRTRDSMNKTLAHWQMSLSDAADVAGLNYHQFWRFLRDESIRVAPRKRAFYDALLRINWPTELKSLIEQLRDYHRDL